MKTTTQILAQPRYATAIESDHGITVSGIKEAMEEFAGQSRWISTANLPTEHGYYLIFGSYTRDCPKKVFQAYFDHKRRRFHSSDHTICKNVTHFQPLPKAPEL